MNKSVFQKIPIMEEKKYDCAYDKVQDIIDGKLPIPNGTNAGEMVCWMRKDGVVSNLIWDGVKWMEMGRTDW